MEEFSTVTCRYQTEKFIKLEKVCTFIIKICDFM